MLNEVGPRSSISSVQHVLPHSLLSRRMARVTLSSSSKEAPDGRRSDVEGQAVSIEMPQGLVLPLNAGVPWRVVASFYTL